MPLFIDDTQIPAKELARKLGIKDDQLDRIIKKPSFRLDQSKIVKKRTITSNLVEPPSFGKLTWFWFKDSDGLQKKLRYAESQAPKRENGVLTYDYRPYRINVKGEAAEFRNKPDLAFFMFLKPSNELSPFYKKEENRKGYTFVDTVAETLKRSENLSLIERALSHATHAELEELVIMAKGLKILNNDDFDHDELRLKMKEYAVHPTTNRKYVEAMESEMIRVEGRIRNLVDKGVFKLEKRGSTGRQWMWGSGTREGEMIGDTMLNPNEDAMQRLMNYVKVDLGNFIWDLRNSDVILKAERKAEEYLKTEKVNVPQHLAEVNADTPSPSLKDEVYDHDSAKAYVEKKGYKKLTPQVKAFRIAVEEEKVTNANVDNFLRSLFADT